jgi:hypothetical protein
MSWKLSLVLLLAVPAVATASTAALPGGAAPRALVGTWQTTLSAADAAHIRDPNRTWQLVVVNGRYLTYPRALGLRPKGSGGDTVPFGATGGRLYLSCLTDGVPSKGYGTYSWTVAGKTLRFKLVSEPCRDPILRDRIVILTKGSWRKSPGNYPLEGGKMPRHGKQALAERLRRSAVLALEEIRKIKRVLPSQGVGSRPDQRRERRRPHGDGDPGGLRSRLPDLDSTGRPFGRLSDVEYELRDAEGRKVDVKDVRDAGWPERRDR